MDAGGKLNVNIRDASTWQVVTKDEHTKISGELDVRNLRNLKRNVDFVGRYAEVNNTSVPAHIAAEGAQAVDQFREIMLYGGTSAAEGAGYWLFYGLYVENFVMNFHRNDLFVS